MRVLRSLLIHCYETRRTLDLIVGENNPPPKGCKPSRRKNWRDVRPDDELIHEGKRWRVMTVMLHDYEPKVEHGLSPLVYSGNDWLKTGFYFPFGYDHHPTAWIEAKKRNEECEGR